MLLKLFRQSFRRGEFYLRLQAAAGVLTKTFILRQGIGCGEKAVFDEWTKNLTADKRW